MLNSFLNLGKINEADGNVGDGKVISISHGICEVEFASGYKEYYTNHIFDNWQIMIAKLNKEFNYKGPTNDTFKIKINELQVTPRPAYPDIQIIYSIEVTNTENPSFKLSFNNPEAHIPNIGGREMAIGMLGDSIRGIIDQNQPGEHVLSCLDLTR